MSRLSTGTLLPPRPPALTGLRSTANRRDIFRHLTATVFVLVSVAWLPWSHAQPTANVGETSGGIAEFVQQQIQDLNHPSFRVRQLARWRLEQYPKQTVAAIGRSIHKVDHNTGAQLINLLSVLATHTDVTISLQAREILGSAAKSVSSIGRMADNAMHTIADLQEEQAMEVLLHHGARIGPRNFFLNARVEVTNEISLHIDESFSGDGDTIEWIRFLKSVESVFLEGPGVDSRHYRAISQLSGLRNIRLKRVSIKQEDLRLFKLLADVEHLGLNYVDVDDSILPTLAELPISQSLRLYGTRITQAGAARLAEQFDGIDIYCGRGGYLGVGTNPADTVVTKLIPGSGAQLAGIQERDKLTHINGVAIANFTDLRTELGKYMAGDQIEVQLDRPVEVQLDRSVEEKLVPVKVTVVLGEDPK